MVLQKNRLKEFPRHWGWGCVWPFLVSLIGNAKVGSIFLLGQMTTHCQSQSSKWSSRPFWLRGAMKLGTKQIIFFPWVGDVKFPSTNLGHIWSVPGLVKFVNWPSLDLFGHFFTGEWMFGDSTLGQSLMKNCPQKKCGTCAVFESELFRLLKSKKFLGAWNSIYPI